MRSTSRPGGPAGRGVGQRLTLTLVIQFVTCWLPFRAYAPIATTAWASVHHITFTMISGWLVRGSTTSGRRRWCSPALHLGNRALRAYRSPSK